MLAYTEHPVRLGCSIAVYTCTVSIWSFTCCALQATQEPVDEALRRGKIRIFGGGRAIGGEDASSGEEDDGYDDDEVDEDEEESGSGDELAGISDEEDGADDSEDEEEDDDDSGKRDELEPGKQFAALEFCLVLVKAAFTPEALGPALPLQTRGPRR